ncbi:MULTISPECIES: hypothetical protein [unclassified Lacrimispora]|uniref:hypothetical protein n=1 Tax=unclassified Lacrimispora TaxID=2719232 RepID=UPI003770038D
MSQTDIVNIKPEQNILKQEITEKQRLQFESALQYMKTAKLILRDLENEQQANQFFKKYKREDILRWLENPSRYEAKLIEVCRYLAGSSQHFRRLYEYFGKMSMLAYVVLPYKLDEENFDATQFKKQYKKIIDKLEVMNIKNEFSKVIDVMFREDIAYCYEYSTNDSYFIKLLPYNYCQVNTIVDGVLGYSFDFGFFDNYPKRLSMYGEEFQTKYTLYKSNRKKYKWQELNSENSFALKLSDNLDYIIPMFANLIPFLYDIEDIKQLDKSKKELDNYKLLMMKLELNDDGDYKVDYKEYEKFYNMISSVLPKNIGIGMSIADIKDYAFERSGTANEISAYSQAQKDFWDSAGVNGSLFSGDTSTAAAINASLNSDQSLIFYVHRMIERVINRKLKGESGKYKFKINILDCTIYNKKEYLDNLLKVSTYGTPTKTLILSLFGYSPADTYGMTLLEDILDLTSKWKPLKSSNTMPSDTGGEGGRPTKDDDDLTPAGEQSRDDNRKA